MEIRLQKILSDAGIASRRKAESLITEGRVTVNGQTATVGGKADPEADDIRLDGQPVMRRDAFQYLMLNKPTSVITSVTDPQGRPVVMDLIKGVSARVYPVGRLDYDTSGLLLLTNDGKLTQALTHPKHVVSKVYLARLHGVPSDLSLGRFRSGLVIDGRITAKCEIAIVSKDFAKKKETSCLVRITLHEGRNRQIRKMCSAIGHPVHSLKRVQIGPVTLGGLQPGQWRYLTEAEITGLKSAAFVSTPCT